MIPSSATGSSPMSSKPPATGPASAGCGGCAGTSRCGRPPRRRAAGARGKTPGPAVHDDLVQREFTAPRHPNVVWLTDITEHPTREGKLYVCAIKDVFSNRIVGYALGDRMTAQLAVCALRSAIARRQPDGTVVVHTRPRRPISLPSLPGRAHRRRARRVDGPGRLRRRQRGDGVVLLAAAEERPQPPTLDGPATSSPTRSSSGSNTPTTADAANARLGKLTPVEFELAFTNSTEPQHDHPQPPSTEVWPAPWTRSRSTSWRRR